MKQSKKRFIIAVSGGPDSMALLNKFRKQIVGVCHVNYHKRCDSNFDTMIVSDFCLKYKIPLLIKHVDPKIYKSSSEHNFQTLARQIRYDFFVECSKEFKCNNLLIAHNLNDFIETAIMQENRKSKNFFYGIRRETTYQNLNIYRPLLNEFKDDLEKYCMHNGIAYAIDSSNSSDIYERNRIRKQLSRLTHKQLLKKYQKFVIRNKQMAKAEGEALKYFQNWKKSRYSISYIKTLDSDSIESVIYIYLKNNKITNVNYNKIKLIRDYIVSNKSNNHLRLGNDIWLNKTQRCIKIQNAIKEK